jgi:hypothetical protein
MPHIIAGIDVHKKMLAVVVTDSAAEEPGHSSAAGLAPHRRICAC